jgi:hypothetical protein
VNNDCFEGNLDLQYMMGIAQDTQTVYWYEGGSDPFVDYVTNVADDPDPPLVNSISWGSVEQVRVFACYVAFDMLCMIC